MAGAEKSVVEAEEGLDWDDGWAGMSSSHNVIKLQVLARGWPEPPDEWARSDQRFAVENKRE